MATPALVVLVVGAVATVLVLAGVLLFATRRVLRAYREARRALERAQPLVEALKDHQAVTSRELDRVGRSLDRVRDRERPSDRRD